MSEHRCTQCAFFEICEDRFRFWTPRCRCFVAERMVVKELEKGKKKDTYKAREKMLHQKKIEIKQQKRNRLKKWIKIELKVLLVILVCAFPMFCKALSRTLQKTQCADFLIAIFLLITIPALLVGIYAVFYKKAE